MTDPHDDSTRPDLTHQSGPPSTAEIAALTARLRALSAAGAAADPVEGAAFLADKHNLLDRITAAHHQDPAEGQDLYVGTSRGHPDPEPSWPRMPAEMREGIAARLARPARVDDHKELAARIAHLRARIAVRDTDGDLDELGSPATAAGINPHDTDADTDGDSAGWAR